jgi:3-methyladenine DNA glycosylase AlkD
VSDLDVAALVAELDGRLRDAGTSERAARERSYLKSDLEHYGVTVPALRRLARGFSADHDDLDHDDLVALVEALWAAPVHEHRMLAELLLEDHEALLGPDDLALLERLLRESRTWALVDGLAASVVGPLLDRCPEAADALLDRWAADDDLWIRRSALLAHLLALRSGGGDFERFGRYADAMLAEKEFFVRKAIGWVLRDTARRRPEMVYAWIAPRTGRASGVTVREVVKRLPPEDAARVLAAYREHRAVDG